MSYINADRYLTCIGHVQFKKVKLAGNKGRILILMRLNWKHFLFLLVPCFTAVFFFQNCGQPMKVMDVYPNPEPISQSSQTQIQPQSQTYAWVGSSWSSCSQLCGGGQQIRTVNCHSNTSAVVSESLCSGPKPAEMQSCNTQACTSYMWIQSGFGPCSASCGGGTQTQTVSCKDNNGNVVTDATCSGTRPASSRLCNVQACAQPQPASTDNQAGTNELCSASNCDEWISSPAEFKKITGGAIYYNIENNSKGKRYCLRNDVDFKDFSVSESPLTIEAADFNGCGRTIKNLKITRRALFAAVTHSSVHDFVLESPSAIVSNYYLGTAFGILVENALSSNISNITIKNMKVDFSGSNSETGIGTPSTCGGLIGHIQAGNLQNIKVQGGTLSFKNCHYAGVLVGQLNDNLNPGCKVKGFKTGSVCQRVALENRARITDNIRKIYSDINVAIDDVNFENIGGAGGIFGLLGGDAQYPTQHTLKSSSFSGNINAICPKAGTRSGLGCTSVGGITSGYNTALNPIMDNVTFTGSINTDSIQLVGALIAGSSFSSVPIAQNSTISATANVKIGQWKKSNIEAVVIGSYIARSALSDIPIYKNNNTSFTVISDGIPIVPKIIQQYTNGAGLVTDTSKLLGFCKLGGDSIPSSSMYTRFATARALPGKPCRRFTVACGTDPSHTYTAVSVYFYGGINFANFDLKSSPPPNFTDKYTRFIDGPVKPPSQDKAQALASVWKNSSLTCEDDIGFWMGNNGF